MAKYKILKKKTPSLLKHNVAERHTKPVNVQVVHMSDKAWLSRKFINPQLMEPMIIMTQRNPFRVLLVAFPPYTSSCGRKIMGSVTGWRESRWNVDTAHIPPALIEVRNQNQRQEPVYAERNRNFLS